MTARPQNRARLRATEGLFEGSSKSVGCTLTVKAVTWLVSFPGGVDYCGRAIAPDMRVITLECPSPGA